MLKVERVSLEDETSREKKRELSHEERKRREALLKQYDYSMADEIVERADGEIEVVHRMGTVDDAIGSLASSGLERNTNAQRIAQEEQQKRERSKQEHQKKVERDKQQLEEQRLKKEREKRRTQKKEKRRL